MWLWVLLARDTVAAECPAFEFADALAAFDLDHDLDRKRVQNAHVQLERIAETLSEDAGTLINEFDQFAPRAKMEARGSSSTPTINAWSSALDTSKVCPAVLPKALLRAAAFSASSSGVEQAFTLGMWAHEGRRGWLSEGLEEDELKLMVDRNGPDEDKELCELARKIWSDAGYGQPRRSGPGACAACVDKGVKRLEPPAVHSEAGLLVVQQ